MTPRQLLPTLVLAGSLATACAQIPNGGFENWVDQGGYMEPVGWLTYNDVITPGPGPAITVEQGIPGATGDFHCVITTQPVPLGPTIQGWISASADGTNDGFPFVQRPAMLTGQWQYGIQPTDSGQVLVALSKWNSITSSTDPIAFGSIEVTGNLTAWQGFSVPLTYVSSETPDTAYIQIVSSIDFGSPVGGSFMKVDDLAFAGAVGIEEAAGSQGPVLFPSSAIDVLNISPFGPGELLLFDATGRLVLRSRSTGQVGSFDVSSLAQGIFSYQMLDQRGRSLASGRWVKE